jgi:hypothetical protein
VLTLTGRWYTAARVLDLGLKAAQALRDRAAEALFAHDRGTLALCQGERAIAQEHLVHALELRQHIGDLHGADVTRHNMTLNRALVEAAEGSPVGDRGRVGGGCPGGRIGVDREGLARGQPRTGPFAAAGGHGLTER